MGSDAYSNTFLCIGVYVYAVDVYNVEFAKSLILEKKKKEVCSALYVN